MLKWLQKKAKKKRMAESLAIFTKEREMIRRALEKIIITEEDIAAALESSTVDPKVKVRAFRRRVDIIGCEDVYSAITILNYKRLAKQIIMAQTEDDLLIAMCTVDTCEEFQDFDTMVTAFKDLEIVIRRTKKSNPTITYCRKYINRVREYLMELAVYY